MPIYQRDPYRSELAGTIADLMLRQGQIRAGGQRQVADLEARGTLQRGQNRAQLFGTLGDLASRALDQGFAQQQRERELAPRREMEQLQVGAARREDDAAREGDWNKRKASEAITTALKQGDLSVLDDLPPEVRQIADGYLADRAKLHKAQTELREAGRQRMAKAIRDFGYDVDAAAIVVGLNDDDPEAVRTFQQVGNDPAKLRQLVDHYAGPAPLPKYSQEDPTKTTVMTDPVTGQRTVVAAGVPETPKPPAVGSFEDFVVRKYGANPTPEQITEGRKLYQQDEDRPRVTVNMPGSATVSPAVQRDPMTGLSAGEQAIVKRMLDYNQQLPSGSALRTPYWTNLIERASLIDPTFDAAQYTVRQRVRQDFTSGKSAFNIRSLNTAVGHLDSLAKAGKELDNSSVQLWNTIANSGLTATGDPRVKNFKTAANAVAGELATIFKNTSGTDQEIKSWKELLDASDSPEQIRAVIDQAIELMGSRLGALQSQYESGMGRPKDFTILNAKSRKILSGLGVNVEQFDPSAGRAATPSVTQPKAADPLGIR